MERRSSPRSGAILTNPQDPAQAPSVLAGIIGIGFGWRWADAAVALFITGCRVRLHEKGFRISCAVLVRPRDGIDLDRLRGMHVAACGMHWRVDEIVVTLEGEEDVAP